MRCAFILLLTVWLLVCGSLASAAEQSADVTGFTDATGVLAPYGMQAQRIVSLAPNVTEMVYYVGLGDKLVGRSDYCNFPPQVDKVQAVGGFADSSLERIVALQPQLVVAYQGNDRELVDELRRTKISVLALNEAASLPEIYNQMRELYLVAGPGTGLPQSLLNWNQRLTALALPASVTSWPKVFFGYPGEMSMTCGPGTFLNDVIKRAGGVNVVTKEGQRWPTVAAEFIVGAQPQWLLTATACTGGETVADKRAKLLNQLSNDPVWSALPAIKEQHLVVIDSDILLRPGPRILDALEQLRQALHPGMQ